MTLDVKPVRFGHQVDVCVKKRHKNSIFGCSPFQKFNFVCLLLTSMIFPPKTVSIFNFVWPLWTWSFIRIWGTQIYFPMFWPKVTNHKVKSKFLKKWFLRSLRSYPIFHDVEKLRKTLKYSQRSYVALWDPESTQFQFYLNT